jgi:ribosomal protein S18 acetylase RimI-like enzyme
MRMARGLAPLPAGGDNSRMEAGHSNPRAARPEESDAVAALMRKVWTSSLSFLPVLHTPEEDRRFFRERVFRDCRVSLVERDRRILGFIAHRPGWVDQLYVDPAWQRRGIGRALMAEAKRAGPRLRLWVFQRNTRAIAFYGSEGFRLVELTDGSRNEEREPDALYEWARP